MTQTDRPTQRRLLSATAFTLLELILVLAIVAVILAVTTANLRGFYAERQVDDTASHLVAVVNQARERAIRDAYPYRVRIDPEERQYQLMRRTAGSDEPVSSEWGRPFSLPENIVIQWTDDTSTSGERTIEMRPDGSSDTFSLLLIGPSGQARVVAGTASSGEMSIHAFEEVELAER